MVEDSRTFELTESIAEAESLFIEDFDTWDMTGYYLYSKYWRAGVSAHIGTGGWNTRATARPWRLAQHQLLGRITSWSPTARRRSAPYPMPPMSIPRPSG